MLFTFAGSLVLLLFLSLCLRRFFAFVFPCSVLTIDLGSLLSARLFSRCHISLTGFEVDGGVQRERRRVEEDRKEGARRVVVTLKDPALALP